MLKNILALDVRFTKGFVKCMETLLPVKQIQVYYTMLEISCHGIPWIASLLALIWILNSKRLYQVQVNLLIGLVLDIIVIAVLKSIARRRRPAVNTDPLSMGPDKYSFPSGHASRSMLVFYFLNYLWPVSGIYLIPILAWMFAVVMSRLLMRRHHILDVIAGLLLGYIEGMTMGLLYLNAETCSSLISWLTDEKIDGADYDV
ncbi:Presqualene diphosphate phosphatase [Habropoda laboriosa]|uniref:Presqualene diphosphate phosphatase n=1 Tax=Habropoda laboriosa TaxID=597456 RepID=A0A0L7R9M5_9HYME|nr:PREDICTED: phospholipid phosphatase 6 [Habropoda laboriosa]KOC67456.1 Presqualene diphosphate phosphatase [Habropoda laboriosa]